MDFWGTFTLCCWVFIALSTFHNIRNMRPRPKSKNEVAELREEALRLVEDGTSSMFEKAIETAFVKEQMHVEYFRLYIRLNGKYPMIRLSNLIEKLRLARMEYRTSLTSKHLTYAHVDVFMQIRSLEVESMDSTSGTKYGKRHARSFTTTLLYALKHLDQADAVIAVIRDRGIYDLKQIRAFLKDAETVELGALSDGML